MKVLLIVLGSLLVVVSLLLTIVNPLALIGVAFGVVLIIYGKKYKKPRVKTSAPVQSSALAEFAKKCAESKERFDKELEEIPRVEIELCDKRLKRQALSDMPEFLTANITRRTNIDKLFPIAVVDAETTGIKKSGNDIIELSAIKIANGFEPVSCFTTLIKPRNPIPEDATRVNHITNEMVESAPTIGQVSDSFLSFIDGCNILGHNLKFDVEFLHVSGISVPATAKFFDTLPLSQSVIKKSEIDNYKLETLCEYYDIYRSDAHRSLSDCLATAKVFERLLEDKMS